MEAVLQRLQTLTPDELRVQLRAAGLQSGPVTHTTRSLWEKRLARVLLEERTDSHTPHSSGALPADEPEQPISVQETQEAREESSETSTEGPSVYYGVCANPDEPSLLTGSPLVFVDQTKALKAVMKLKDARFKAFASRAEAENFAKGLCGGRVSPEKPSTASVTDVEKANEFRSPRTQDLTATLRRTVETGDQQAFRELVWTNPRFLIGSGDNPTVLQEGCRYNVLHVAAKENQAGMARLLLETLEDPEFMKLMYPQDQENMLSQRIRYIVDLYLNTPDRASNETPLHFACKFGCPEVVNVLCSHPFIDKHCRNKYDQQPSSVICERKNRSKDVKQKILQYLEDRFYVPLLRAEDNTLPPVIGAPWCPGAQESCDQSLEQDRVMDSPKNPIMTIRAFVGPLSSAKAEEFQRRWKTPPREQAQYFHQILKSDAERGAERVGRELAHQMGYTWAEHWAFLNAFTDLSSRDGLKMLEEHLSSGNPPRTHCPAAHTGAAGDAGAERLPVCDLLQEFEKVLQCGDQTDGESEDEELFFTADEDSDDAGGSWICRRVEQDPSISSSVSSSCSSFKSTHSTTTERDAADVFITGPSPSRLDHEVLVALNDVQIDLHLYPTVSRWRNRVVSYSPSQRQSWPAVSVLTPEQWSSTADRLNMLSGSPRLRRPPHCDHQLLMFSPTNKTYRHI